MNRGDEAAALRATLLATLLALAACTGNAPIPSGAQQVQVSVTASGVVLQPESVPAGDVYLVLDDGSISFVERKAGAYGTSEPLSEEQIAQIGDGNLQDTSVSGLEANNCDSEQNAAARGMTGPCGNVMLVRVQPSSYLIVAGAPEEGGAPSAVLTVTP
ncbi:MAG TPA: hypothetical protein VFQ46_02165 [Candidatus Limnocylindria bacterium]|nr:hypothetical protein [Candidatus Limnocylindria bacterium]